VSTTKELMSTKDQGNRVAAEIPGEERRRSQRVIIQVPVTLVIMEEGRAVNIPAHTVAVNVHGAMVVCSRSLEAETRLQVVNERTRQRIDSRVTRVPRDSAEGFLIPVEFTSPSPDFWQITFPPSTWKTTDY
jgi:hypothetical protein